MTSATFVRDRFTWQAYAMLTWFAYHQSSLGPIIPFLRDELDIDYTVAGFHTSAFALGVLLVGVVIDTLIMRIGRHRVVWACCLGMVFSILFLILGSHPAVTILGTFLLGAGGVGMVVTLQAALVDNHEAHRTIALSEMMAFAGVAGVVTPLMVGGFEEINITWRIVPGLGILLAVLVAVRFWSLPIPKAKVTKATANKRSLPAVFWLYWLVMFLGIAAGWCMGFWSAEFLHQEVELTTELAAALVSVYYGASVVGRLITGRLSLHYRAERILIGWVAVALIGFPLFWLSPVPLLNVAGLFLSGLSMGNTVALVISAATQAVPNQTDAVNARTALGGGLAILIMPQMLGALADLTGIKTAFGIVMLLLIGMVVMTALVDRLSSRRVALPG